jgi:hypothetical protein
MENNIVLNIDHNLLKIEYFLNTFISNANKVTFKIRVLKYIIFLRIILMIVLSLELVELLFLDFISPKLYALETVNGKTRVKDNRTPKKKLWRFLLIQLTFNPYKLTTPRKRG